MTTVNTKQVLARTAAPAGSAGGRDAQIYDRHAPAIYGQAMLMLDDERLARRVAHEVIVTECALPPAAPRDAGRVAARLSVSTLRCCQELLAARTRADRATPGRHARGRVGPQAPDASEQALLGLVLFGGMGYHEAARELAISPQTAAAMLRSALVRLSASTPILPASSILEWPSPASTSITSGRRRFTRPRARISSGRS